MRTERRLKKDGNRNVSVNTYCKPPGVIYEKGETGETRPEGKRTGTGKKIREETNWRKEREGKDERKEKSNQSAVLCLPVTLPHRPWSLSSPLMIHGFITLANP
ncbi:hypothetical protein E2C01_045653 [Portunus trituberculatus]|uniref:Uncharacterized protein n=1 Tax=Portunus trituberculatus TaxID=210409 RepID=A0A5B7G2M3_PORTR|nr:hypothetical protein [Portunus trituberculatus]